MVITNLPIVNGLLVLNKIATADLINGRKMLLLQSNISGCVAARNSVRFGYPLRQCVQALRPLCDEVVLSYDPTTDDGTHELALELRDELDIVLFESPWDMSNMQKGLEIGHQSQVAVDACSSATVWRLCVQQDEAFHEDDHDKIRELVRTAPNDLTGIDFVRPYFYGNLHTIRRDWTVQITRLTRKGTHTYDGFDGQNCLPLNPSTQHFMSGIWMFHYSRIGDPAVIARRVRNVDTFFHAEDNLPKESDLQPYDFTTREYDSYAFTENPKETNSELLTYMGTHPLPFAGLYQKFE
jgi:hypothetical protein